MRTLLFIFVTLSLNLSAQVNCAQLPENYSGRCESYDQRTKEFGTYTYKKGLKHGEFTESYSNKQLKAEGSYKSDLLNGDFSSYYESGERFAVGRFKGGSGTFVAYHQNGNRKLEGQFEAGQASGKWTHFDVNGKSTEVVEMSGVKKDMFLTLTNPNESIQSWPFQSFSFGSFGSMDLDSMMAAMQAQMDQMMARFQGQMDGFSFRSEDSIRGNSFSFDTTFTWGSFGNLDQLFDSFSDTSLTKSFHFDTLIRSFSDGSTPHFGGSSSDLVDFPDAEPSFMGGEEAMKEFIESEMTFPENYRDISVKGTVFVEAIIEKDGSISHVAIALGLNELLDKEALRIVESMPNWNPAMKDEKAVRTRSIIPIHFEG